MIKPEIYNDTIDNEDNEIKLNHRKKRNWIYSDWWKYNSYFMYTGEKLWKNSPTHNKDGKYLVNNPIPTPPKIKKYIALKNFIELSLWNWHNFSTFKYHERYNAAQPFTGIKSKYRKIYGMKSESGGSDALLDFFQQEGVPLSIKIDNPKDQTRKPWTE